jgi:hypothetical protein
MDPKLKAKLIRQVKTTNKRLKAANVRVSVMVRGESLSLRGWLPGKYGEGARQQTVSLKMRLSEKTIARAEAKAHILQDELDREVFDWAQWGFSGRRLRGETTTATELIEQFKAWKIEKAKDKNAAKELLRNQQTYLKRLEGDKPLSVNLILGAIRTTAPNTRSRQAMCLLARQLAKFGELGDSSEWFGEFVGSYDAYSSPRKRTLPSDDEILQTWRKLTTPQARWAYGMIATYGLRNHELYHVDLKKLRQDTTIHIAAGKTGARLVMPLHPHWPELMNLQEPVLHRPKTADGNPMQNKAAGNALGKMLARAGAPGGLYSLRHAFAIRGWRSGLDLELMARLMGNSAKLQERVYRRWLEQDQLEQMVRQKLSA